MDEVRSRVPPQFGLFVAARDVALLEPLAQRQGAAVNRYAVEDVVAVLGEPPPELLSSTPPTAMIRTVGQGLPVMPRIPGAVAYVGMAEHLHYTDQATRQELLAVSRSALGPSPDTRAVVVPLRKTDAWWNLAQDERQAHFQRDRRHTAIGLDYAARVFRTLYHSRYAGLDYDFVTYFEFERRQTDDFRSLLAALRDTRQNPEWAYVDLEYEIWLTKVA